VILSYARREVITADPDDRIRDLAGQMEYYNVGCLVIVEGSRPVGIVTDRTDRDLALRVLTDRDAASDLERLTARDVMTPDPRMIHEDEGFDRALERMRAENVRRLPVVDRHGRLRGIVSLDDIIEEIGIDMRAIAVVLKHQQRVAPAVRPPSRSEILEPRR
jgi:CBS domain-containing protein